ncbi:hypothetical protein GGI11_003171 [Coemansia sp. RSA 2049]|nr:hypothetical protein GGI11_003171 [Coemansia sp. RSA 2049]
MFLKRLFLSALLLGLGQAIAQAAPVGGKTHILNKSNFESTTKEGTWLVKHFSPYCPHCRTFQPKWENAVSLRAQQLGEQGVYFGELDCSENTNTCRDNGVTGWPSVIAFQNGKRFAFIEGDKSEQEALDFIDKAVADSKDKKTAVQKSKYSENSVVLDASNFTQNAQTGVWLVKHYSPYCPHCNRMKPEWTKMTDDLAPELAASGILFGEVNCLENRKLCEENHVDGYPTINLFVNGKFVEEMVVKYRYDPMKEYAAKLPKRLESGELQDKTPEPVVANDNRDWDDVGNDLEKQQAKQQQQEAEKNAPNTDPLAEKPDPDTIADGAKTELGSADKADDALVYNAEGVVVELTKENFAEKTSKGPWFIKFYAEWCPHCQHLAPVWEKLADSVKGRINIGSVNCEKTGSLCTSHGVQGYPTLKMLWEGETNDYKGSRDLENLLDYVDRMLAHPIDAQSVDDLHRAQKDHDVVFVFAYDAADTAGARKAHAALDYVKANAKKLFLSKQLLIASTAELGRQILPDNSKALPVLAALKDGNVAQFGGHLSSDDDLREWFYAERFSILPELSRENSDALFYDSDYLVLAVLDTSQGDAYVSEYRDIVRSAAVSHQHSTDNKAASSPTVRFAWVDGNKWDGYIERVFRVRRANWPAIIIAQPNDDSYYVADARGQPIEPSKMGIFMAVRDAVAGKLRSHSNKSIIIQAVHGVVSAVNAVWAVLFATTMRAILSLLAVVALVYLAFARRGRSARRRGLSVTGTETLVKAD